MPIYEKPVRALMLDMVRDFNLKKQDVFTRDQAREWFAKKYPKLKQATIDLHLIQMSTNAPRRIHHRPKKGVHDVFYQIDSTHYRLYDSQEDPSPIYVTSDLLTKQGSENGETPSLAGEESTETSSEFAYESDLRNFLSKNLSRLEAGLKLYRQEDVTGVEFPAGGRFIDILAVDAKDNYVVIELKVSRGYDRVVGQVLRYMAWIKKHHAEPPQRVRGIIVARDISDDLILACASLPDVELFNYELSFQLNKVSSSE